MLKRWEFWTLTVVALATAALVVANMYQFSANRELQAEVSQRGLFNQMVTALADLSARTGDQQIRSLLSAQGIQFQVNPPAGAAAAGAGEERR